MELGQVKAFRDEVRRMGELAAASAPMTLCETFVALEAELDSYASAISARIEEEQRAEADRIAAAGAQLPPEVTSPVRVPLGIEPDGAGSVRVVPKSEQAAPAARTLQAVVDLMARKPVGSIGQLALEVAAHIETLELENAQLRAEIARLTTA